MRSTLVLVLCNLLMRPASSDLAACDGVHGTCPDAVAMAAAGARGRSMLSTTHTRPALDRVYSVHEGRFGGYGERSKVGEGVDGEREHRPQPVSPGKEGEPAGTRKAHASKTAKADKAPSKRHEEADKKRHEAKVAHGRTSGDTKQSQKGLPAHKASLKQETPSRYVPETRRSVTRHATALRFVPTHSRAVLPVFLLFRLLRSTHLHVATHLPAASLGLVARPSGEATFGLCAQASTSVCRTRAAGREQ